MDMEALAVNPVPGANLKRPTSRSDIRRAVALRPIAESFTADCLPISCHSLPFVQNREPSAQKLVLWHFAVPHKFQIWWDRDARGPINVVEASNPLKTIYCRWVRDFQRGQFQYCSARMLPA